MDRLTLVELIEHETAKLTPEGRDLAERMELLAEASPGGPSATYETQRAQADEAWDLSPHDRSILDRVLLLWERLATSDEAERGGGSGERDRVMAVIVAAGLKDRHEGRMIDPDMTVEQALERLRGPG